MRGLTGASFLRLLAILPCIHLADSTCSWKPTPGAFAPAQAQKAVTSVDPSNIRSSVDNVNGLSLSLETLMSYNSTCDTDATYLKVKTKNPGAAIFSGFDDSTAPEAPTKPSASKVSCALDGLALEKEDATATSKVLLRFDFYNCTGPKLATAKTGTSGSAVVQLVKVPDTDATPASPASLPLAGLSTFFHEVCQKKPVEAKVAPVQQQVKLEIGETPVGMGQCKGTKYRSAPVAEVGDQADCKMECVGSIEKYVKLEDKSDMCTGYGFVAKNATSGTDQACDLYKGTWAGSTGVGSQGWCWNMTEKSTAFSEDNGAAEAAAAAHKKELEEMKTAPRVAFESALLAEGASVALYESPESCFDSFFWTQLQNSKGGPSVLKIKAKEYDALFGLIPAPTARRLAATGATTSLTMSHVVYTESPELYYQKVFSTGAIFKAAPAAAPAAAPECVNGEVLNAAVTALLMPFLTWMVLWVVFEKFLSSKSSQYAALDEDSAGGCNQNNLMILILVAILVGAGLSFGLTHILGVIFTPVCAATPHGLTLITISSGLSGVIGIGVGLYYISTPHHAIHAGGPAGASESKFMLVRVQGNKNIPVSKNDYLDASTTGYNINLSQA